MLILSRKLNESIVIDGRIVVKILRIDKDAVKLGVQAPPEIPVHREEIQEAIQKGKSPRSAASASSSSATPRLEPAVEEHPSPHTHT